MPSVGGEGGEGVELVELPPGAEEPDQLIQEDEQVRGWRRGRAATWSRGARSADPGG